MERMLQTLKYDAKFEKFEEGADVKAYLSAGFDDAELERLNIIPAEGGKTRHFYGNLTKILKRAKSGKKILKV